MAYCTSRFVCNINTDCAVLLDQCLCWNGNRPGFYSRMRLRQPLSSELINSEFLVAEKLIRVSSVNSEKFHPELSELMPTLRE